MLCRSERPHPQPATLRTLPLNVRHFDGNEVLPGNPGLSFPCSQPATLRVAIRLIGLLPDLGDRRGAERKPKNSSTKRSSKCSSRKCSGKVDKKVDKKVGKKLSKKLDKKLGKKLCTNLSPQVLDGRFGIYAKNAARINGQNLDWLRLRRFPGGHPRLEMQL